MSCQARLLGAVLAVAILTSTLPLSAQSVNEDVTFGVGLIKQQFYALGIEVLQSVEDKIETEAQREQAWSALREAYSLLARRRYVHLSSAEETKLKADYSRKASEYEEKLADLRGTEGGLDALLRLRHQAMLKAREFASTPEGARKKALLAEMTQLYERTIRGLQGEIKRAAAALKSMAKTEPDFGSPKYDAWHQRYQEAQFPQMSAGIELGRTRYEFYRALPNTPALRAKRQGLLKQVINGLERLTTEFDRHAYAILGFQTLSEAYYDSRKFNDALQISEAGAELVRDFVKQDTTGQVRTQMMPWYAKLMATWGLSTAQLGRYAEAVAQLKQVEHPDAQLALGEVYLLQAARLTAAKKEAEAQKARSAAEAVLESVAKAGDVYRDRVQKLSRRYGAGGAGYHTALSSLEAVVRQRDNKAVIEWAQRVISYSDDCPPERRMQAIMAMGLAYWQEQMFLESAVVYMYLAAATDDEEEAQKYARYAVACFQRMHAESNDPADRSLFEEVRVWQRDNYGGPGVEYSRGSELKRAGKHLEAVAEFQKVPGGSLYHESAMQQIGECYILAAKELAEKDPAESKQLLAKGRAQLEKFMTVAGQPTQFPKVRERRTALRAATVYRLADADLWPGQENFKACIDRTADFEKRFPESEKLFPFVALLRTRALVRAGDLLQAEVEMLNMQRHAPLIGDEKRAAELVAYLQDLVFGAYVKEATEQRSEVEALQKRLEAATEETEKIRLRNEIEEKDAVASETARKALAIFLTSLAENEKQPYDKLLWAIHELGRLNMTNEQLQVIDAFLRSYEKAPRLTAEQRKDIDTVKLMRAIAYQRSGEFEKAYEELKARYQVLDREHKALLRTQPNATPGGEYWTVLLNLGRAAKALGEQNEKFSEEAVTIFLRLRSVLPRNTDDWWDVTVGIAEVRNAMGQYEENLVAVGRFITTQPKLGGSQIRLRYLRVLEEIYRRAQKPEDRKRALNLMVEVQAAELSELATERRFSDMLRVIQDFRLIAIDYGGERNRERFRKVAEYVQQHAPQAEIKAQAAQMVKDLGK